MVDIRDVHIGQRLLLNPTSNMFYSPNCKNVVGVVERIDECGNIDMRFKLSDRYICQLVRPCDADMIECREVDVGNLNIKDLF